MAEQLHRTTDKDGKFFYYSDDDVTICERCGEKNVIQNPNNKYYKKRYCDACIKIRRKQSLKKARKTKFDKIEADKIDDTEYDTSPTGAQIKFRTKTEKRFYAHRYQNYMQDYEFENAADLTLLSRILALELECHRIEEELFQKYSQSKEMIIAKLSDEIRKIQQDLGINRFTRLKDKKESTVESKVREVLEKYRKYKEKNRDRFVWRCKHCGKKNILNRENHDNKRENNEQT